MKKYLALFCVVLLLSACGAEETPKEKIEKAKEKIKNETKALEDAIKELDEAFEENK